MEGKGAREARAGRGKVVRDRVRGDWWAWWSLWRGMDGVMLASSVPAWWSDGTWDGPMQMCACDCITPFEGLGYCFYEGERWYGAFTAPYNAQAKLYSQQH